MKKLIVIGWLAASAACWPLAYGDEADSDHHFVKDSILTTKVKTKLLAKHPTTLDHVKVDTDQNGVVWLSGTTATQDERDLAGMIAQQTDGVRSVNNRIEVVPR